MATQTDTNQFASFPVHNCLAPVKNDQPNPLALPITLDFSSKGSFPVDIGQAQDENQFDFCQAVFFDNSSNAHDVTLTFAGTQQAIILRASKQGYLPVLASKRVQFTAACGTTGGKCNIHLLNFPVPAAVW